MLLTISYSEIAYPITPEELLKASLYEYFATKEWEWDLCPEFPHLKDCNCNKSFTKEWEWTYFLYYQFWKTGIVCN